MPNNLKLYGIIAVLVAFLALIGVTFYYYSQFKSTEIKLTDTKAKLVAVEKELKDEKANNVVLASEVKASLNRLKLMSDLYDTAEKARLVQLDENKKLQSKVNTITVKLPKPIPKTSASTETPQELENSELRIKLIWEVFCVNNPTHETCQGVDLTTDTSSPEKLSLANQLPEDPPERIDNEKHD